MDFGHSAWQAPVLVQLPNPSSSILATIALARRAPSTRPLATAPDNRFHLVMSETEGGQTTKFYLREAEFYYYSELLMLTYGTKETVAVNIYGQFDLKQVARLSSIRPQR